MVSVAAVLANASWFSATAVLPSLRSAWNLTAADGAWLVVAVQVGFVVGSVGAAVLNLPDRLEPRRLIAAAAVVAGTANAGLVFCHGLAAAVPIRFLVGVALAGVYAPAVRLVATYFERGRGMATGVVVGALTLGSGMPHLVGALGSPPWQETIVATSALALVAAIAVGRVDQGPARSPTPTLDVRAAARAIVSDRPVRLATFGYLGHMWELYAMWSWLAVFFAASRGTGDRGAIWVGPVTFLAVGAFGMAGSVAAGWLADRAGRTFTTSAAMLISAGCCLTSPVVFGSPMPVAVAFLCIWGAAVIADSAQFSAAITELADPQYSGSVLALQLAFGFMLTIASIRLVPVVADVLSWQFALVPLAIGPLLGTVAMLRLRGLPASLALANGRR